MCCWRAYRSFCLPAWLPACLQEKKVGMDSLAITPAALAETLSLIDEGVISGKIAKDVLPRLLEGEGNSGVRAFVEAQGLVQISGKADGFIMNDAHAPYCPSK
jgi:aspartyl-tRNA(Asn)/glutamyl-tRNA(Gln) amidotransferase subunit B